MYISLPTYLPTYVDDGAFIVAQCNVYKDGFIGKVHGKRTTCGKDADSSIVEGNACDVRILTVTLKNVIALLTPPFFLEYE